MPRNRNKPIRVVQYGLGHIGREVVRVLLDRPEFRLVGVIDTDPLKAGRPLAEFTGEQKNSLLRISDDAGSCLRATRPQVVIHATGSSVRNNFPQFEDILRAGAHCVSSTEELVYPKLRNPGLARRLDALARRKRVAILGTGINPGFVMDVLPLCLAGVCQEVKSVSVTRVLDARRRRLPLQLKIGATLTSREFRALARAGRLGHVGLVESLLLLADGLGWKLDRWTEHLWPKIARRRLRARHLTILRGRVTGLRQIARGYRRGRVVLTLDLSMFIGAQHSHDLIEIDGTPPIRSKMLNGIHGDRATVAALINAVPRVVESGKTGLISVLDLPLARANH